MMDGWLLDVYEDPQGGVVAWIIGEDGARVRLRQEFPVTFYAAGPSAQLRMLWRFLESQPYETSLERQERQDLFSETPVTVLACTMRSPYHQPRLFRQAAERFPDLTFYDADVPVALRYAAAYSVFPLAKVQVEEDLTPRLDLPPGQRSSAGGRSRVNERDLSVHDSGEEEDLPRPEEKGSNPGRLQGAPLQVLPEEEDLLLPEGKESRHSPPFREGPAQRSSTGGRSTPAGTLTPQILTVQSLDSPWELDPAPAPLRILSIEPDTHPFHAEPKSLEIRCERASYRLPLNPPRPLLVNLRAILQRHDPDLILSTYGDTWLFPLLMNLSHRCKLPLRLSRDWERGVAYKPERSYFTYGQIVHRGQQYLLFGRPHIDRCNAMLFHDYGLAGVFELSRVTGLSLQTVARTSPGTGISAMQILTALRRGVLVPWHKQQAERPKTVLDMLHADQGGMVYQPTMGLHQDVAEVDFISMYPSIMAHFNLSPETVGGPSAERSPAVAHIPQLNVPVDMSRRGLVPETLDPLLGKRLRIKEKLADLPAWDPRREAYQAMASAHKWLLVTCFGYLGYKNARFGRIEAHEAVTAYGREALLRAKEAAEGMGFEVLHLYVDGMWVKKPGARAPADFAPLLDEIVESTGLPIALDGVYRWVAFVGSRVDARVPVANRYFGAFQDGSIKVRGIEARRADTAPFIARTQMEIIELLAKETDPKASRAILAALSLLQRRMQQLRMGRVAAADLIVSQKLSRELDEYRTPSPAARAAAQLEAVSKSVRPGQRVKLLYTLGEPGVFAWDLPYNPDLRTLDLKRYATLLLRAAAAVLTPMGWDEEHLRHPQITQARARFLLPIGDRR